MIKKPTLLVLGAGASEPYGFPVARKLKTHICNNLSAGNDTWKDRIEHLRSSDVGEYSAPTEELSWERAKQFGEDFQNSPITSIDEFLDYRSEYRLVGKASIALSLIPKEERRRLFDDQDKWYTWLFNHMSSGIDNPEELSNNNLRVITFNYDRSFEEFFVGSLVASYGMERIEAVDLFEETVDLSHAYGSLGSLFGEDKRDYNDNISHEPLTKAIHGIELIYEVRTSQKREKMKEHIKHSSKIVFMGFGYHEENLKILSLDEIPSSHDKTFWGTSKGFGTFDMMRVENLFNEYESNIKLQNYGCLGFLQNTGAMI